MSHIRVRLRAEAINLLIASGLWNRMPHHWHMRIWDWYSRRRST